ncbi:MAG: hypothetical protein KDI36_09845 [Pseudomonadales bacterium]|nr:hypothetical protein [Pseudomonadales bacterium]
MILLDILTASLFLGLPVMLVSWWVLNKLYDDGKLERSSDSKSVSKGLKSLKRSWKDEKDSAGFLEKRWMKFGGGFYGLTALLTFIWIEITGAFDFVFNFPGFEALFRDGVISFLVSVLINQVQNFVTAFLWFFYWPDEGTDRHLLVWVLVPYGAYWLGMQLASREWDDWLDLYDDWRYRD